MFLEKFDIDLSYHLGKENVFANTLNQQDNKKPEQWYERNEYILALIYEYNELESLAMFDFNFTVEVESVQELSYVGSLSGHPTLLFNIVKAKNWDDFAFQVVYDLVKDNLDDCPANQFTDAE